MAFNIWDKISYQLRRELNKSSSSRIVFFVKIGFIIEGIILLVTMIFKILQYYQHTRLLN